MTPSRVMFGQGYRKAGPNGLYGFRGLVTARWILRVETPACSPGARARAAAEPAILATSAASFEGVHVPQRDELGRFTIQLVKGRASDVS